MQTRREAYRQLLSVDTWIRAAKQAQIPHISMIVSDKIPVNEFLYPQPNTGEYYNRWYQPSTLRLQQESIEEKAQKQYGAFRYNSRIDVCLQMTTPFMTDYLVPNRMSDVLRRRIQTCNNGYIRLVAQQRPKCWQVNSLPLALRVDIEPGFYRRARAIDVHTGQTLDYSPMMNEINCVIINILTPLLDYFKYEYQTKPADISAIHDYGCTLDFVVANEGELLFVCGGPRHLNGLGFEHCNRICGGTKRHRL